MHAERPDTQGLCKYIEARKINYIINIVLEKEGPMKVTAFNGSPKENGNTAKAVGVIFEALNKEGIETELVQ
ncbi:MAG TPA: NAD(P)H-dependent oxidoreductase, partial [Methanosarcinales archaeon]|nr:NAD(P)H-dependent oxidoreductase [Methanosarcinales archaeon]